MTRHPLQAAIVVVAMLVAVSVGAYAVQQARFSPAPPTSLATPIGPAPSAEAPVTIDTSGGATPVVAHDWLVGTSHETGVPEVALAAYARAQLEAPPRCHLGWTTLAGIGWVESQHGTLGGRILEADGRSSTPILGPPLDGTHHTQAIAATPQSTALHGDLTWDHAVGPLQFLPSTWEQWAADGDDDGREDPDDIDDAALAAADYLCADGHDLATAQGWTDAVVSYNHDRSYLEEVHATAEEYAARAAG